MSKYSKIEIDRVKREADIRSLIPGATKSRLMQDVECPFCGKAKKFRVSRKAGYNNARCFACEKGFPGPLEAYAHYHHLDIKSDFLKVLEGCASECGVIIVPEEQVMKETVSKARANISQSFCAGQLEASGISVEDIMANVIENGQEMLKSPFRPGSVGPHFSPDFKGGDMLIFYYDLYGRPVTYVSKGSRTPRPYVRVRYANPAIHVDERGSEMKYQTPAGAPSQVYIPEKMRALFKSKTPIDVLFLQEGEKKAEKACKHGILSLGIQGISNIGSQDQGLIQAIQDIVIACKVRHIVLVMDSDWNDLSRNITTGDRADKRPNSFAAAVIKFNQYIRTFNNLGLNVDTWWAHVNANDNGDKGIDDLLVGSLKGREGELLVDITHTMNSHNGKGTWLDVHKISSLSDAKIRDFWHLNDYQAFFEAHRSRLAEIPTFKLGGVRYKVENGAMVPVSRYSSDVDIYSIVKDSKDNDKVIFNYSEAMKFLTANGFSRLLRSFDGENTGYEFIRIDDGIIFQIYPFQILDFIQNYIMANVKSSLVREFFISKLDVLLPDKKLARLPIISDNFNNFEPDTHRAYYNNGQVEISAQEIKSGLPFVNVWQNRLIPRKFRRLEVIKSISKVGDTYYWELTPDGEKCEFLQYLINTSNNYYSPGNFRETNNDENCEWLQHIVNKVTAIGYLISDWKYPSDNQAVVIQDHRISEVGQAWGGAGKSVLGKALSYVSKQFFIDGKQFAPTDQFVLSGVTKATRHIFIDDIKPNFDFQFIFNWITGPMPINPKGGARFTIPEDESPKILVTTNHAIKGADQGSVKRRVAYVEFSSWYNQNYSLYDDFHHMFFSDWDEYQWTLFDNLMAECVMYYFRSFAEGWHREGRGVVPPPMKNIELRTLRQSMSETFFQWAEEYYDPSGSNLNRRIPRNKEIWPAFLDFAGGPSGHSVTRSNIKKRIQAYCKYKGYDFNINRPMIESPDTQFDYNIWKKDHPEESFMGDDDKSGGVEFFTVWSPEKEQNSHPF
ncbi:MAG: hypothetical protein HDR44_01180 [Allobaculum sp.]|nr:hypothetical protein [Allobaculum sp.]